MDTKAELIKIYILARFWPIIAGRALPSFHKHLSTCKEIRLIIRKHLEIMKMLI